jgi:hypothetical protein
MQRPHAVAIDGLASSMCGRFKLRDDWPFTPIVPSIEHLRDLQEPHVLVVGADGREADGHA